MTCWGGGNLFREVTVAFQRSLAKKNSPRNRGEEGVARDAELKGMREILSRKRFSNFPSFDPIQFRIAVRCVHAKTKL
jgi:hypothetical protein